MLGGPNPSITGSAIGEALGANAHGTTNAHGVSDERMALDEAELRDLEREAYARVALAPTSADPPTVPAERRTSLIRRLFRR